MRVVTAAEIDATLRPGELADALFEAFAGGVASPERHHHAVPRPGRPDATLLLMPAWHAPADAAAPAGFIGVKVVSVFPDNASRGHPTVNGSYLLVAGESGAPLAVLDGVALTLWRTAAASALAARFLARRRARRLVMVGAGTLAPYLVAAHAAARPIEEVAVWNRSPQAAERLAARLGRPGLQVTVATDLEAAVRGADVVSCATLASEPLVRGAWLRPGAHLDLVGGFRPSMREADDDAVRRASVFVDTRAGALAEAGDIVQPIAAGVLAAEDVAADLFDLCRGTHPGRRTDDEITLFKSVGTAIEDLAAAAHVHRRLSPET
jgi:alanine dehydrogenase